MMSGRWYVGKLDGTIVGLEVDGTEVGVSVGALVVGWEVGVGVGFVDGEDVGTHVGIREGR